MSNKAEHHGFTQREGCSASRNHFQIFLLSAYQFVGPAQYSQSFFSAHLLIKSNNRVTSKAK